MSRSYAEGCKENEEESPHPSQYAGGLCSGEYKRPRLRNIPCVVSQDGHYVVHTDKYSALGGNGDVGCILELFIIKILYSDAYLSIMSLINK